MKQLHLVRKVAAGSAVDAFLADSSTGTLVVQLSHPRVSADPELFGRFLDTARSTAMARKHRALLSIERTQCSDEGRVVSFSAPTSGRTAADHLRDHGGVSGREVRRWAIEVCDALDSLHSNGVVHGHLAPINVFLDGPSEAPRVRLLDTSLLLFRGVSKSLKVNGVLVAPEYLSPERCSGKRATKSCDVYGLGVLIHELLTGDPPFKAEPGARTRSLHLTAPVPALFPGLEEWEPVLRGCLAKRGASRLTVLQVRALLERLTPMETPAIIDEPLVEPPDEVLGVVHRVEVPLGDEPLVAGAEATEMDLALALALQQGDEPAPPAVSRPAPAGATKAPVPFVSTPPPRTPAKGLKRETAQTRELAPLEVAEPIEVDALDVLSPATPAPRAQPPSLPASHPVAGPGDVIGRYRLEKLLGEGGMGQVFEATNLSVNRRVALKLLRRELSKIDTQVRRFIAEAQAVNRVKHPNIIAVEDLVNDGERVFFVMELLAGKSLKVITREAPVELRRTVRWMRQAAEALAAAHEVGVIHRDLKPDNVMVVLDGDGREQVKVLDFGVARVAGLDPSVAFKTQVGQVVGTPLWMAPEQVLGHEVDPRADVYSLAMVMFVLITRKFPFAGELSQVVMQRLSAEPQAVGEQSFLGEPIPGRLQQLLKSALSRDRGGRPASMAHFAKALASIEREVVRPDDHATHEGERRSWWHRWRS
jgi:serine/threonine protein kinase